MFNKNLINVKAVYEKYNRLLVDPKTMNVACLCNREVVKLEGEFADYDKKRIPWGISEEEENIYKNNPEYQHKTYVCPNCNKEHIVMYGHPNTHIPISHIIFDEIEKSGKLVESKIDYEYTITKGIVVRRKVNFRKVMNLNTGMTYELPMYVDGHLPKRGRLVRKGGNTLKNVTYRADFFDNLGYSTPYLISKELMKFTLYKKIIEFKKEKFGLKFYSNIFLKDLGCTVNCYDEIGFGSLEKTKTAGVYDTIKSNADLIDLGLLNRYPSLYIENYSQDMGVRKVASNKIRNNPIYRVLKHDEQFDMRVLKNKGLLINKKAKKYFSTSLEKGMAYAKLGTILTKVDNVEKIVRDCINRDQDSKYLYNIAEFLRLYKWKQKKDFAKNENTIVNHVVNATQDYDGEARDAMRMFVKNISKIDFKFSFRDIENTHDRLAALDNMMRSRKKHYALEYTKKEQALAYDAGVIDFRLAKGTKELVNVGGYMNICVGSYGDRALNKNCYIVVGYKEEEPFICIEINNDMTKIDQFKFKRNEILEKISDKLDDEDKKAIDAYLNHALSVGISGCDYDLSYIQLSDLDDSDSVCSLIELYKIKAKARKRKKRKENVLQLRRARRVKRKIKTRNKKSRKLEIAVRPRMQVIG